MQPAREFSRFQGGSYTAEIMIVEQVGREYYIRGDFFKYQQNITRERIKWMLIEVSNN